ncbi:hypothetical protein LOC64_14220 [Rubrivivax sp. JA1029]|uniref:GNAT family N-acetyltransferase n=1 Tax=Rubrivivax sp. JA1029 TaxID=2894193 RepID=UPI001E2E4DC3|nr:hypothetical protein [Rubrivivax sp. JA1029]MCC9648158.1 hypothetical protein [Rubrivivax sp. JA1029]
MTLLEQLASGAITLRPAVLADAPAVYDAHRDSVLHLCAEAYTPAQMAAWFEGRSAAIHHPGIEAGRMTLAERDGRVLGFCAAVPGEVTLLFVRPEAAGSGLGGHLLHVAVLRARQGHDGPGDALHDLQHYARHDALPLGLVARLDGHPCGFMALKREGLASLPELGPWVGAAVVHPGRAVWASAARCCSSCSVAPRHWARRGCTAPPRRPPRCCSAAAGAGCGASSTEARRWSCTTSRWAADPRVVRPALSHGRSCG